MKINWVGRFGIALFTAAWAAGCTTPTEQSNHPFHASVKDTQSPNNPITHPTPTPTPPRIAAQVVGGSVTLFGKNGEKVAMLRFESAGYDPKSVSRTLIVSKAKATLYDKETRDVPAAEMTADAVTADRQKRTLTATGNATIRSLTERGTPTIRADRMVWSFDNRTIKGDGNVLLTAEPNLKTPGKSFSADTRLRTFQLESDGRPATGGMP